MRKYCSGCQSEKDSADFYRDKHTKSGYTSHCKVCRDRRTRRWQLANPDRCRELARETYLRYADEYAAMKRAFRSANPALAAHYNRFTCDRQGRRRARLMSAILEVIDRDVVFEACHGVCHICGNFVDPSKWDLEHLIPLARGGTHCYDNVAVSHPHCNKRKGYRLDFLALEVVPVPGTLEVRAA